MTLSPQEVTEKTFTPTRLREGYEMSEVDDFLDQVEATVSALTQQRDTAVSARDELESKIVELTDQNQNLALQVEAANAAGQSVDGSELEELQAQLQAANAELAAANELIAQRDSEIAALSARVSELSAELDNAPAGAPSAGNAELIARVEAAEAAAAEAAAHVVEANAAKEEAELAMAESEARALAAEQQAKSAHEAAQVAIAEAGEPAPLTTEAAVREASSAAARLLDIATRNAESIVHGAENDAALLLAQAEEASASVREDARVEAEKLAAERAATRQEHEETLAAERAEHEATMAAERAEHEATLTQEREEAARALYVEVAALTEQAKVLNDFDNKFRTQIRTDLVGLLAGLDAVEVSREDIQTQFDKTTTDAAAVLAGDFSDEQMPDDEDLDNLVAELSEAPVTEPADEEVPDVAAEPEFHERDDEPANPFN